MICRFPLAVRLSFALVGCLLGSSSKGASLLDNSPDLLSTWKTPLGFVSVQLDSATASYQLSLSTGGDNDPRAPLVGAVQTYAGSPATLNVSPHPSIDAGGPVEGSAVAQTFSASAGAVLTIQYDFLTAEAWGSIPVAGIDVDTVAGLTPNPGLPDDFAFLAITHAGVTTVTRLADVFSLDMTDASDLGPQDRFNYHTGFHTLQTTLNFTGSYTLTLGVLDGGSALLGGLDEVQAYSNESVLLVSQLDINSPGHPVPIPMSATGGLVLLTGLILGRRL